MMKKVYVEFKKKLDGIVYKRRTKAICKDVLEDIYNCKFNDLQIEKEIKYALSYYNNLHPAIYIGCTRNSYKAKDDGINAGQKTNTYTPTVEINGGTLTITIAQGDSDGIDSNGYIYVNGGVVNISGQSAFDYDLTAEYNGGTIIVNGVETKTIDNQFMGGGMSKGSFGKLP